MKSITAVLLVSLLSGVGWCFEAKDNPDKVPSIGLTYEGASLKGDEEFNGITFITAQPQDKETINNVMADFRLPVSNNLTLEAGGGYGSTKFESNDGTLATTGAGTFFVTTPTSASMTGPIYKVGARYYFQ